jgi:hypothetical protein
MERLANLGVVHGLEGSLALQLQRQGQGHNTGNGVFSQVGLFTSRIQITHSLKLPGYNPWNLQCDSLISKFALFQI